MKSIGYHERLGTSTSLSTPMNLLLSVNIIACVTESCPRLLVTEYCDEGDLLSFLKRRFYNYRFHFQFIFRRDYMLDFATDNEYINADKSMLITQEHQFQYAVQIAYGMVSYSHLLILKFRLWLCFKER